eukprot:1159156-Pelagomonas_calceolata.AAC.9
MHEHMRHHSAVTAFLIRPQMSRSGGLSLGGRSMSPVDPSGAASLEDSYLPLTGLPGLDGPRPVFCLLHEHDMQQVKQIPCACASPENAGRVVGVAA